MHADMAHSRPRSMQRPRPANRDWSLTCAIVAFGAKTMAARDRYVGSNGTDVENTNATMEEHRILNPPTWPSGAAPGCLRRHLLHGAHRLLAHQLGHWVAGSRRAPPRRLPRRVRKRLAGWLGPWCIGWAPAGMAEVVSFHHRLLLDDDDEIGDVIRAFHKVWNHLRAPR